MNDTITIIGRVGDDPRSITTAKGDPMVAFRLASTERKYDSAQGQWVDGATNWYGVQAFRSLALNILSSVRRGDRVIVTGKLKVKQWENATKSGTSVDIDADGVGHDLLFGTTAFTKRAGWSQSGDESPTPLEDSTGPDGGGSRAQTEADEPHDGWSLPPGVDSSVGGEGDRELVGADTTPF